MTATYLLTDQYRTKKANFFVNSFSSANQSYYFFVGDFVTHANTSLQPANNSVRDAYSSVWDGMVMGKKITSGDVFLAIRNIPYVSNTVYAMYDDRDTNLSTKDYYVTVNAGSYSHTFKCLDNNANAYSTVPPDFAEIVGANTNLYQTADGYRWKYMYSVSDTVATWATDTYFPYIANSSVSSASTNGAIEVIKVESGGAYYNNYIPNGVFQNSDIRVGNNVVFALSNNSTISTANGFYNSCILYMTTGLAAGTFKTVSQYMSNSIGNFIVLDSGFSSNVQNGDNYQLYPQCVVYGNGKQTINCVARALVNSTSSNSVYRIEVLQRGEGYFLATANIAVATAVGANNANVRPIISPPRGHGANGAFELEASTVIVKVNLSNTESGTILANGVYKQFGVVENPMFANVYVTVTAPQTSFTTGELIDVITPQTISVNCSANVANLTITGTTETAFMSQYNVGQKIMLTDLSRSTVQVATIASIANNKSMNLSSACTITSNNIAISYMNISETMVCSGIISSTQIIVGNTTGRFLTGSVLVGESSGAYSIVSQLSRNDVAKPFTTYIELIRLNIASLNGNFADGEVVGQGSSSAYIHTSNSSVVWIAYPNNPFIAGINITGTSSGATASVTKTYGRELINGSGNVLYYENIDPITRANTQTETFKLTFLF